MSIFGNRGVPEPEVDGNGMPIGDSNRHAPLRDEDELAAQFAQAMRAKQASTPTAAPPGAKPEEGDMSGTFPFDEHLDEASRAALWMLSDGKLTQIAQELSDFFGSNVNWRDVKKLAGLAPSARSSSKVQRKLVWDAVEELILAAMEEAEANNGEGSNADTDAGSQSEPSGEGEAASDGLQDPPPAADTEPESQFPPEPEPTEAQAEAEPSEGDPEPADPPEGEPQEPPQEGEAMEDHEIIELQGLVAQMKAGYSVYQGLRQMDQYDRDRHLALHPESKGPFDKYQLWIDRVSEIFKVEAKRQDPNGDRLPYGDKGKWNKWVWRKLQLLLHPDSTNSLTRDDLEALFANGRRANAGASAGSSQSSQSQRGAGSSGSRQHSQQSQSSSSGKPANFDRMVKMARQFVEQAPIERWTYTRTDHNNQFLNAGFIRLVARYGLTPFKEAFAADMKDLSPADRNELASKVFKAAFAQILTDTFG